ncbi:delta 12 fatty acid desaturase [Yamadazyma tenuis]|uniref:Oleate delta-12 desaturase n=1 Tax=Candida tenuis (strain ATCC 10573 / BCRC 21748 / CBS 615 / JCM 9827 / NBRC 10315 / NRRL Y-1498 / VKM Y-70) TaxID=590646 RepID=G3B6R3_CANTC|nr:oleate delta-12 desaturase [Yamadazyma tenuis ATCC 10573]EGV62994.1 oleate delta-12 desaturase [Yamadazyma tenuis ATCC 10573]WEJ97185.1 delta 12 fatty acid desaturase [Yamadazyma tenuis]
MSQVFNSSSGSNADSTATTTGAATISKAGNIASFSPSSPLTAIDTYGNTFEVPDFTIKDILSAIPKHCYNRSMVLGFYYVLRDIALLLVAGYIANTYVPMIPSKLARTAAYAGYAYFQGLVSTGLWVLAHECGHQAFSNYGFVNDAVGWVLHSYLMVPYFSWKYSHSMHHKSTGNLARDMTFVPKNKQEYLKAKGAVDLDDLLEDSPIYTLVQLVVQQLFGWIAYLFANVSGQRLTNVSAMRKNHFNPNSVLFDRKAYWYILLSDLGLITMGFVLYNVYKRFGGFSLLINWVLPYILVNHWLVFITFLQHSDPELPHYEAHQWNFARGAATTIDREFGFVGEYLFHDIIETHVLHHFVSRIPFYNAREASEAIKKVMGKHYRHTDESMWVSLWKSGRWCQYVDGDNGVMMYRNVNGLGMGTKLK